MMITVTPEQIALRGLMIGIEGFVAEGFKGSPDDDAPIPYIHLKYYEGKLQIDIRDGSGGPIYTHIIPRAKPQIKEAIMSDTKYHTKYDLVNVFSGKTRTITHKEAVKLIGKAELLDHLETGMYGDNVIAPAVGARPIRG